jgi:hypothetical protein
MTKFFIKWRINPLKVPDTPEEVAKGKLAMLEGIKAALSAGRLTDWGQFGNGKDGYAMSELSEDELYVIMLRWFPFVEFDVFPVLSADQSMEAVKKAAAAMQA